jgi:hypothetical protein
MILAMSEVIELLVVREVAGDGQVPEGSLKRAPSSASAAEETTSLITAYKSYLGQ